MKPIYLAILSLCLLASCSGGLRIEKRHYRAGYYISKNERAVDSEDQKSEVREAVPNSSAINRTEDTQAEAEVIPDDSALTKENSRVEKPKAILGRIDSAKQHLGERADSLIAKTKLRLPSKPKYDGPSEGKKLFLLQRIAWILFACGLLLVGIGIIWAIVYFDLFVIALAGPVLIGMAFIISLVVMILSILRHKKYAGTDSETAEFYRRMRNQAMVIVGIVTLFLLLLGFMWLVSVTAFGS